MKNLMILSLLLFGFIAMAQDKNVSKEIVNNTVVSTYFYENGQVAQKGSFKDGKLHGSWVAYDENGKNIETPGYPDVDLTNIEEYNPLLINAYVSN
jgi:antitoxin component YwqK of YwqJK toxin-antitoxin module